MIRVRSPQDLGAGVVFIAIGVAGVYFGSGLEYGSAMRMGPGYFPTWLSWIVIAIGLLVGRRGLAADGPLIEPPQLRPLIFINGAILIFGLLVGRAGLAISVVVLTVIAALARPKASLIETVALALALSGFAATIFVLALGQSIPLWWTN